MKKEKKEKKEKKVKVKITEMTDEQLLEEAKKIVAKRRKRAEQWIIVRPKLILSLVIVAMLAVTFAFVNSGFKIDATVSHDGSLNSIVGVNAQTNSPAPQTEAPSWQLPPAMATATRRSTLWR